MEAALVEALEWQRQGPAKQGGEEGSRPKGPARSVVSQITPDTVGCSSTLATADSTYPIRAKLSGRDGMGGRTQ